VRHLGLKQRPSIGDRSLDGTWTLHCYRRTGANALAAFFFMNSPAGR